MLAQKIREGYEANGGYSGHTTGSLFTEDGEACALGDAIIGCALEEAEAKGLTYNNVAYSIMELSGQWDAFDDGNNRDSMDELPYVSTVWDWLNDADMQGLLQSICSETADDAGRVIDDPFFDGLMPIETTTNLTPWRLNPKTSRLPRLWDQDARRSWNKYVADQNSYGYQVLVEREGYSSRKFDVGELVVKLNDFWKLTPLEIADLLEAWSLG